MVGISVLGCTCLAPGAPVSVQGCMVVWRVWVRGMSPDDGAKVGAHHRPGRGSDRSRAGADSDIRGVRYG